MGVYAVTLVVMGMGFRWCAAELARRQAIIERKDELIERVLPLVAEVGQTMATVNERSATVLALVAHPNRGSRDVG